MTKKIIIIFAILIMLFNIGSSCFALEIQSADLVHIGTADYHLQYFREDRGYSTPVVCSIVGYYNEMGNFLPAYCLNKDLPGAEVTEYTVNINSVLNNDQVWRVIKNGWPYKTAAQMGLNNDFDAFAVTKFAIYCILNQSKLEYYSAIPGDVVGEQMLRVLQNLVNIGLNGTETKATGTMSIQKVNGFLDAGGYYYQDYKVSSSINMSEFTVSFENMPEGSGIADTNNSGKTTFSNGEIFRILIPTDKLKSDINGKINIVGKCETYPIFLGEAPAGLQNYVITYGTYGNEEVSTDLKVSTNTGSLKVVKVDEETKVPIEGVSFTLKSVDGKYEQSGKTDKNGILEFNNLYPGKYILTEIATGENYILGDTNENIITIEYNKKSEITIGNEVKRGKIKIIKEDSETGENLEGVEFNILDAETGSFIEKLTTNEEGEAISSNLRVDRNYILQEVKTLDNYVLGEEEFYFNVEENEVFEIVIENEVKRGKVKVIKIDGETEESLTGVEFNILDKDTGEFIEKLVTDENGEAESSDLRVDRDYILQEVKTLEKYILNDEIFEFNVTEDEILEIEVKNMKQPEPEPIPELEPVPEPEPEPVPEIHEEPKILPKTGF